MIAQQASGVTQLFLEFPMESLRRWRWRWGRRRLDYHATFHMRLSLGGNPPDAPGFAVQMACLNQALSDKLNPVGPHVHAGSVLQSFVIIRKLRELRLDGLDGIAHAKLPACIGNDL